MAHTEEKNTRNILLIMERDHFEKDTKFINNLAESLTSINYEIMWYNPHGAKSSHILDPDGTLGKFHSFIRKPLKLLILMRYPADWPDYFKTLILKEKTYKGRCKNLKRFIKKLGNVTSITILSRSAGGIVSSHIADELGIKKLICLGYPFKNPDNKIEPERFIHLEKIKTPFLIVQGTEDIYGGTEVKNTYKLSSQIKISFIETDHDFKISDSQWETLIKSIENFILEK